MKLTILRGIPASGKSTYAKQFLIDNPDTVRVNMDSLRLMFRNEAFNNQFEKLVKHTEIETIKIALSKGFDVIVDDTNLTMKRVKYLIEIAKLFNPEIEVITMNTHETICSLRNEKRDTKVPVQCMLDMEVLFNKHVDNIDGMLKAKGIKHTVIESNYKEFSYKVNDNICETECKINMCKLIGSLSCEWHCSNFISKNEDTKIVMCTGETP